MRERIPVVAVNLENLERKFYPSFVAAANHTGISKKWVSKCYRTDTAFKGWYICPHDQIEARSERIRYLSNKWIKEGMPIRKPRKLKPGQQLVSLRIDRHTVIMVTPEKATEQYAAKYREKLRNQVEKRLKSPNY